MSEIASDSLLNLIGGGMASSSDSASSSTASDEIGLREFARQKLKKL